MNPFNARAAMVTLGRGTGHDANVLTVLLRILLKSL